MFGLKFYQNSTANEFFPFFFPFLNEGEGRGVEESPYFHMEILCQIPPEMDNQSFSWGRNHNLKFKSYLLLVNTYLCYKFHQNHQADEELDFF